MTLEARLERAAGAIAPDLALVALLCVAKAVIDACVLRAGFSHVSDDDYARTVIAEQFSHAPKLDPSGTSWLPLPFWLTGAAMWVLGRSLAAARAVGIALGLAAAPLPFVAMRSANMSRAAALAATLVAMALPWTAWLGAAMVPDGWTAALVGASAIAMTRSEARPWCAAGLFVASLSRYESWAACLAMSFFCGCCALGERRRARDVSCAVLAIAGPVIWMLWNAHAHGDPFHFIARVSAFRRSIGAADVPLGDKLLGYPRTLVREAPEAAVLGVAGAGALFCSATLRRRWQWPAACALAIMAFLVAGDLGDGAPTHHPARALGPVFWVFVGFGVDAAATGIASLGSSALRLASVTAVSVVAATWVAMLPARWAAAPGNGPTERRDAQIARGRDLLRHETESAEITPCQFEHFALIAAWGQPERAHVKARTGAPVTVECPIVRDRVVGPRDGATGSGPGPPRF